MTTVDTRRAMALLQARLDELEALSPKTDAAHAEWREKTVATIGLALPEGHRAHNALVMINWTPGAHPTSPDAYVRRFENGRSRARAILKAAIFELEESVASAPEGGPVLAVHELKALERLLADLRRADDHGELHVLDSETRAEFDAEVQTIQAQLHSPKPKRSVVRAALESLRNIAEHALGGAGAVGVVVAVKTAAESIT